MSLNWLNAYLEPADVSADEADHVLTHAGFPIEGREEFPDLDAGDIQLDVELTSNRGDCLAHVGLAREVAAATGRALKLPQANYSAGSKASAEATSVENRANEFCPRFCARVIEGVKVGQSPQWLKDRLEAIGQRSINNVVDATNFVLFELGHPSHVFDLDTLDGERIVVRHAEAGETIVTLDDTEAKLISTDVVVADASKPVSIAGVIGGKETGVTDKTTRVLLEMATWHPATIRRTARRLGISTDACYRYERFVDQRDLDTAMDRLTALILELAGGEASAGIAEDGIAAVAKTRVVLRPARVASLLGIEVPTDRIAELLTAIGVDCEMLSEHEMECLVPHHRHDLSREVDLIEEIIRLHCFDHLEMPRKLAVPLDLNQPAAWDRRETGTNSMAEALVSAGFYETVTFSFETQEHAEMFLPEGWRTIKVDEERRRETPYLRPCILPGLLTVRAGNQDARVEKDGGIRLFEIASTFAEMDDGDDYGRMTVEKPMVGLLIDAGTEFDQQQQRLREMTGAIQAAVHAIVGPDARIEIKPRKSTKGAFDEAAYAWVELDGEWIGYLGLLSKATSDRWGIEQRVIGAELDLGMLVAMDQAVSKAHALPAFPVIERDLSVVFDESVAWASVEQLVRLAKLDKLEAVSFVGVYRGKQIGGGKKSLTFRMTFRDEERTLRHEEVDPQIETVVKTVTGELGGEVRSS
ncbi:MAG: phenylalanine--tRNA ligase subunit beta [Planctomycetota bacterium]